MELIMINVASLKIIIKNYAAIIDFFLVKLFSPTNLTY